MTEIGYVTLEAADDYVKGHFLSKDTLRLTWEKLSAEDKEVLLRRSFESIELLPFAGRKACLSQPNAFPRWPGSEVPAAVIAAQVENAVAMSDDTAVEDAAYYERLRRNGIESYSIGNLSENLGGTSQSNGILSTRAMSLLQPFISGGFSIRR